MPVSAYQFWSCSRFLVCFVLENPSCAQMMRFQSRMSQLRSHLVPFSKIILIASWQETLTLAESSTHVGNAWVPQVWDSPAVASLWRAVVSHHSVDNCLVIFAGCVWVPCDLSASE